MDIGDIEAVMFTSHLLFGVSVCSGPNEYSMFLFLQVNVSNFESDLEPLMELFISIPHVHLRIKWISFAIQLDSGRHFTHRPIGGIKPAVVCAKNMPWDHKETAKKHAVSLQRVAITLNHCTSRSMSPQ